MITSIRSMITKELIAEISDLPVEERAKAVDEILKTFNRPEPKIEKAWIKEVRRRKKQVESGEVELIPGEEVFKELRAITEE